MNSFTFADAFATAGSIGKRGKAPGTIGSILGVVCGAFIGWIIPGYMGTSHFYVPFMLGAVCIVLTLIGIWATDIYMRKTNIHDPKEIIIDEIIGQMLVLLFGPLLALQGNFSYPSFLLSFLLFRLFDITKPSFIGWCDRHINNAWGVMMDDIAAAMASILVYYALLYLAKCFDLSFLMYFFL